MNPRTKKRPRTRGRATGAEKGETITFDGKLDSQHPLIKRMLAEGRSCLGYVASIGDCFDDGATVWDRETHADFSCPQCRTRVEKKLKIVTGTPYVMCFLGCRCSGAVAHVSGDPGPVNARQWKAALRKLRKGKMDLLILNSAPADASGLN